MAPLPLTFPTTRTELEGLLREGKTSDAERLVSRLEEKARLTRSRELNALAWFAKGLVEDGTGRFSAAEQSLLVSVGIGRELFREDNDALGHAARSLGFVYAHLERADAAAEMFLLARNVFLKTTPALAPEVVRFAASCNIALRLPDQALAIVHQELGAPEALTVPKTADELDLYLVRARAFEEEHKPVQALKTLARLTQLLMPGAHARTVVAKAWLEIARTWGRAGDRPAASHALACAGTFCWGNTALGLELSYAEHTLGVAHITLDGPLAWRVQRAVGDSVAFASPERGLFFDTVRGCASLALVAAERTATGGWSVRLPSKAIVGWMYPLRSGTGPGGRAKLRGTFTGAPFEEGDVLHLDDGLSEPCERRVVFVSSAKKKLFIDAAPDFARQAAVAEHLRDRPVLLVGTVWAPTERRPPQRSDDELIRELLRGGT